MNPMIENLAVYDLADVTPGVAADLSHINTPCKVTAHKGAEQLGAALTGADLVVIPAGIPRKPGMTRDDLFNINAGIVKSLVEGVAANCPNAIVNIISNPVNSTVPIAAEVMKKAGCYDPRKIMGVTTLDIVRANTFVAEASGLNVADVNVPVIGGHAGTTILPLLSQATPSVTVADPAAMTTRIQNAGTEVVEAKAGAGSATLSMAYAAARMAESVLLAKSGEKNVVECTYVESNLVEGLPFFSSRVVLGPDGVAEFLPLGELNDLEKGRHGGDARALDEEHRGRHHLCQQQLVGRISLIFPFISTQFTRSQTSHTSHTSHSFPFLLTSTPSPSAWTQSPGRKVAPANVTGTSRRPTSRLLDFSGYVVIAFTPNGIFAISAESRMQPLMMIPDHPFL